MFLARLVSFPEKNVQSYFSKRICIATYLLNCFPSILKRVQHIFVESLGGHPLTKPALFPFSSHFHNFISLGTLTVGSQGEFINHQPSTSKKARPENRVKQGRRQDVSISVSPCQALDSMFETTSLLPDHALMDVVGALGRNLRLRYVFVAA